MVRLLGLVMLIVLGVAGVAGGGLALGRELTRQATRTEVTAAVGKEIATRWERLPAGKIFPAKISYQNNQNDSATATLVGIAPPTSCRASLEPSAYQRIRVLGCSTMLRATYVDAAGTLAATVGIGVMPSPSAVGNAMSNLDPILSRAILYTVSFSGTITDAFGNADRGDSAVQQLAGPYIYLYTAGYTDGLPGNAAQANQELAALGSGIINAVNNTLTSFGNPCSMKDIHC